MTKNELRSIIREALREELTTKNKLTESSSLSNIIKTALNDTASSHNISEIAARVRQKMSRVDFPKETDMSAFKDTTIFKSTTNGDYIIKTMHLPIVKKVDKLANDIYDYERISLYAGYEIFQFLLDAIKIPFQVYFAG